MPSKNHVRQHNKSAAARRTQQAITPRQAASVGPEIITQVPAAPMMGADTILALQRTIGNQGVGRILQFKRRKARGTQPSSGGVGLPTGQGLAAQPQQASGSTLQRTLMTLAEFKEATGGGSLLHPRKRIEKIDRALKTLHTSGGKDMILLTILQEEINTWLAVAEPTSSRRPGVEQLRDQVKGEIELIQLGERLAQPGGPSTPPQTRERRGAFSAQITGAGKTYGSDFSDFDSKQFRVTGRPPDRRIEEVKRRQMQDGTVVYYAMGLVTNFNGKVPVIAPYPEPRSLGDWYPSVTHINGMNVAPTSGILSAVALQESVNRVLDAQNEVAFGQDAVDVLYTYSAQRGNPAVDVWDCIKGKLRIEDEATRRQEDIMLDAVRGKNRVTVSAHSRGTIKTDNAVRNVHEILTNEFLPEVRGERFDEMVEYWRANDPGIGLEPELLAEVSLKGLAQERAKQAMNAYIQLVYAGNAVQYPSDFLKVDMFVGGMDVVSMFVGTYSETGRAIHAAIGIGGTTDSSVRSVGGGKGHGFVENYIPGVSQAIANDLRQREE